MDIEIKLGSDKKSRTIIFLICIIVVFCLLILRLFYLQIIKGNDYKEKSKGNRIKVNRIAAPRGKIYDRKGKLIATNVAGYKLAYLDTKKVENPIFEDLSIRLNVNIFDLKSRIKSSGRKSVVIIAENEKIEVIKYVGFSTKVKDKIKLDSKYEDYYHRVIIRTSEEKFKEIKRKFKDSSYIKLGKFDKKNLIRKILDNLFRKGINDYELRYYYKLRDKDKINAYILKTYYREFEINNNELERFTEVSNEIDYLRVRKDNKLGFIDKFILRKDKVNYMQYYEQLAKKILKDKENEKICSLLNIDKKQLLKRIKYGKTISRYNKNKIIDEDLDEKFTHKLLEKLDGYPFLDIVSYPKRKYIYGSLGSHFLGYVKSITNEEHEKLEEKGYTLNDIIGKKGIEKYYDIEMQGVDGYEYIEVDANNRVIKSIENQKAIPGKDLYLTIDLDLQKHITDFLDGRKAGFVAADPKTGEILVSISSPEYDLNKFASRLSVKEWNTILHNENKPMQNRVTVGSYPPGSIFKPVMAFALLENDKFEYSPNKKFYDNGVFELGKGEHKIEWRAWKQGGHGYIDLYQAMEESSNTYFYYYGNKLGHQRICEASHKLGLGEKSGIDIYEEKTGRIPDEDWKKRVTNEPWYGGDTINMSIGQGYVLVTPMQMLQAYSTIANEGVRYKAHLLKKIVNSKGELEKEILPEELFRVEAKADTFKAIKEALRRVIIGTHGTGKIVDMKGINPAGKTGSAENSQYDDTHGWFAGYAPYDNPEIVFVCFMEGLGHGGSSAGPIVKEFLKEYTKLREGDF